MKNLSELPNETAQELGIERAVTCLLAAEEGYEKLTNDQRQALTQLGYDVPN